MTTTTMVHVRVDEQTKAQAAEALAEMGSSVSDAVRVFLRRVAVERAMPFPLRVPNAETQAAMAEADEIARDHRARFASADELLADLEKNTGKEADRSAAISRRHQSLRWCCRSPMMGRWRRNGLTIRLRAICRDIGSAISAGIFYLPTSRIAAVCPALSSSFVPEHMPTCLTNEARSAGATS